MHCLTARGDTGICVGIVKSLVEEVSGRFSSNFLAMMQCVHAALLNWNFIYSWKGLPKECIEFVKVKCMDYFK